jgi:hypothetical protein
MKRNKLKIVCSIFILFFFFTAHIVKSAENKSASLYLSPAIQAIEVEDEFAVDIKITSAGQFINSAEGSIDFDINKLEATNISKSGSVFRFWATEPSFNNKKGTIVFAGGLTTPGFKAENGTLFTIYFKPKAVGVAQINFSSGAILANDGLGTNIINSMGNSRITIVPRSISLDIKNNSSNISSTTLKETSSASALRKTASSSNVMIVSATHPDQNTWYKESNIDLSWNLPAGISECSISLDSSPEGEPNGKAKGEKIESKSYKNVPNGIWYFHLKPISKDNKFEMVHYRILIDNNPPAPFNIAIDQSDPNDWPTLHFKTTDANSGLSRYEVMIGSLEKKGQTIEAADGFLRATGLEIGEHTALVRAVDMAGNETYSTANFVIQPIETPVIKDHSSELKESEQFYMSGTSLPEVSIDIFIQDTDGKIVTKSAKSDQTGNWQFVSNLGLSNGHYLAWVQAVNKNGISSMPSEQIEFLVSPPVFAKVGIFIINYVTVFVSLVAMILLIIICSVYLWKMYRGRLRKETKDIERVLHYNMETLKKKIDSEIADMAKGLAPQNTIKSKIKARLSLRQAVDATASKIYKEVNDVKRIIH